MNCLSKTVKTSSYLSDIEYISESLLWVRRYHSITEARTEIDVHGGCWSLALMDFSKSEPSTLVVNGENLPLKGLHVLILPPFSILSWSLFPSRLNWEFALIRSEESTLVEELKNLTQGQAQLFEFKQKPFISEAPDIIENPLRFFTKDLLQFLSKQRKINVQSKTHLLSKKVKKQIEENFRSPTPIQKYLFEVHPSASYLSRIFKADYGLSPVQYRQQLRSIQAALDLLFENHSVDEVQHSLGISDASYFYRTFRECLKTTPAEFRWRTK